MSTRRQFVGDTIRFHYALRDSHLTFVWKGGDRSGKYELFKAVKCDVTGLCALTPFPKEWRLRQADIDKIVRLLRARKIMASSSGN